MGAILPLPFHSRPIDAAVQAFSMQRLRISCLHKTFQIFRLGSQDPLLNTPTTVVKAALVSDFVHLGSAVNTLTHHAIHYPCNYVVNLHRTMTRIFMITRSVRCFIMVDRLQSERLLFYIFSYAFISFYIFLFETVSLSVSQMTFSKFSLDLASVERIYLVSLK